MILMLILSSSEGCPLWFIKYDTANECQCGDGLGVVECDQQSKELTIETCYCMTYNNITDQTVVGFCLLNCRRSFGGHHSTAHHELLQILTTSKHQITEEMCGDAKRTGQLCGECLEGYGLPVYSYSLNCVSCSEAELKFNILKYITVAFLPLTLFYFFMIFFKITITSGNMVGSILICQVVTQPTLLRMVYQSNNKSKNLLTGVAFYSVWNLDFFRSLYTPFCIHPKITILHVLTLDYLVGVYPLFLIFLTYNLVTLHDRYPIVVKIWRPAYGVFMRIRKEWNIRGSLIQAFASFLILSYVKILNVSFDLLFPVYLQTPEGEILNQTYLFSNPEIEYFGRQHIPYCVLAIVMLTVFNIIPALLILLYPLCCIQKCLNSTGMQSIPLKTLMDVFQGCYRHTKRDCRYFAAFYLLVRIIFPLLFLLLNYGIYFKLAIHGLLFTLLAIVIVLVKPYKKEANTKTDIFFFLLGAMAYSTVYLAHHAKTAKTFHLTLYLGGATSMVIVLLYNCIVISKQVLPKKLFTIIKRHSSRFRPTEELNETFHYRYEEHSPLLGK
jgi:hypothetical protein